MFFCRSQALTSTAKQHQLFTAASILVFALYTLSVGTASSQRLKSAARKGLLVCLASLAALSSTAVHARRSYLLILLVRLGKNQ